MRSWNFSVNREAMKMKLFEIPSDLLSKNKKQEEMFQIVNETAKASRSFCLLNIFVNINFCAFISPFQIQDDGVIVSNFSWKVCPSFKNLKRNVLYEELFRRIN